MFWWVSAKFAAQIKKEIESLSHGVLPQTCQRSVRYGSSFCPRKDSGADTMIILRRCLLDAFKKMIRTMISMMRTLRNYMDDDDGDDDHKKRLDTLTILHF